MAIWSTSDEGTGFNQRLHEICFKTNLDYDNLLLPFDIDGLRAHGRMLVACNYIPAEEGVLIDQTLQQMRGEALSGELKMRPEIEDCHTLIEEVLIERIGDPGKKLYMARSRNDQVVSATRLWTLDKLNETEQAFSSLCQTLLNFAETFETVPMPGYTHTQRAMPSSVGLWAASYLEILLAQVETIRAARTMNSVNVLGSAAGYGTAFNIDREMVTRELGVERTQVTSISAQISRGQVECQTLQAFWGVMMVINRICNDLVWMTSAEFGFFDAGKQVTTGSSIMPNKKNLDPCEIIRARYHVFCGHVTQIQGVVSNLFFGYNSDYQETKAPFIEGLRIVSDSIEALEIVLRHTTPVEEKLNAAFSPDIFATDLTNRFVMQGQTFRDAYRSVKQQLSSVENEDPAANIAEKTHLGAPGNPGLNILRQRLETFLQRGQEK